MTRKSFMMRLFLFNIIINTFMTRSFLFNIIIKIYRVISLVQYRKVL